MGATGARSRHAAVQNRDLNILVLSHAKDVALDEPGFHTTQQ